MSVDAKAAIAPSLELDAQETKAWLDALSAVIDREGPERAHYLLEQLLAAQTRDQQVAAGRALDRVLLWQHYSIPNWYLNYHRLAYRNRFAFVTTPPYSLGLRAWWLKASEKPQ